MEEGTASQRYFLLKAGIIVGSGGLIFGYDIGVISGTLTRLEDVFNLSSYEEGLVVSILYVGSILGSLVGGPLCDYLGRWKTIHIQNILFCVGSLVTGLATSLTMLCIGRFIVGIASAVSGIADVPYLNEISPPQYRGVLSSQYEIAVSIGVLVSFAIALALSGLDYGWRIAFIIPSALAVLQSCLMILLPESPRWLLEKGLLDKTRKALSAMYGVNFLQHCSCLERDSEDVPVEIREYLLACDKEGKLSALAAAMDNQDFESAKENLPLNVAKGSHSAGIHATAASKTKTHQQHHSHDNAPQSGSHLFPVSGSAALKAIFQEEQSMLKEYQYPIYLIVVIQVLSQITGGNVIRNYAPTIFENGGVSTTLSLVFNLIFGVVKTIFTFVSIYYIDETGRLKLLVYGIVMVGAGMLFLAITSLVSPSGDITNVPAFVVGCALVFAGFGVGYGPVPWVLSAEMFPTLIRGRIMSLSLLASNVAQLVVNLLFLPMCQGITTAGTFFVFVALNILTFFFVKKFFVETKEIDPSQILASLRDRYVHSADKLVLMAPWFFRPLVRFCCCSNHLSGHSSGLNGANDKDDDDASAPIRLNQTQSEVISPLTAASPSSSGSRKTQATPQAPHMHYGSGANNTSTSPGKDLSSKKSLNSAGSTSQRNNPLNRSQEDGSGVGSSNSKLTLLSAAHTQK